MNEKLNIGIFCDAFYPMIDGVVNVINNIATRLNKTHNVTVFVPKSRDKNYVDNFPYKVVRCNIFKIKFGDYDLALPKFDRKFKKELKNCKLDIVHAHSPFAMGRAGIKYAKTHNIPAIITMHSQYKKDFYLATKSKLITNMCIKYVAHSFNKCSQVWTMNKKCEELSYYYGNKRPVKIIPNGCDLIPSSFSADQIKEFKNSICNKNEKLFLFVGRIHELKNIEFIIKGCAELKKLNYSFKMKFVGSGPDTVKYTKMIDTLKLSDCVQFVGRTANREELGLYYAASDLFLFPSHYDCDCLVKSEAAAYKTPTIFLENSIESACVTDGFNGFVTKNDPVYFANKIIVACSDETKLKEVGENALKTIYKTWDDIVKTIELSYFEAIQNNIKAVAKSSKIRNQIINDEELEIAKKPHN